MSRLSGDARGSWALWGALEALYTRVYKGLSVRWIVAIVLLISSFARAETIRVSAAISLRPALEEIEKAFENEKGDQVELNYGSSGELMAQIRNGAQVDLFISAARTQVTRLEKEGQADDKSERVVARNVLVLIVPADSKLAIAGFADLGDAKVRRLAIGEPRTVPAGEYAMQTLRALKLEKTLEDRLVYGLNVRQVLTYVETRQVDAGIVYRTDALESAEKVKVVATAEEKWHEPIEYWGVVIKGSAKAKAAKAFLDFLSSEKAQAILKDKGFEK